MTQYALLISVTVTFCSLCSALYFDMRYQRIPNRLCQLTLLMGLIINISFYSLIGLGQALSGAALALAILLPAYKFRLIGGGDVKIMVAIGAIIGPILIAWSIAYAIIFGAFTSVLIAMKSVGLNGLKLTFSRYTDSLYTGKYFKPETGDMGAVKVPYAPALALGWVLACYLDPDIHALLLSFA
ncbi:prepilin peptidase [Moritella sp. 24]|uniref:A24 family peptidase n=1 Tax=Moritella sp. 24 TaxID=2746230 RepID=UPI001BA6B765|nr:A24 family peptidase [Moritella sp. 24]QUM76586.1 prepilin peptidase [Moritella sp. 24]